MSCSMEPFIQSISTEKNNDFAVLLVLFLFLTKKSVCVPFGNVTGYAVERDCRNHKGQSVPLLALALSYLYIGLSQML